MDHTCDDTRQCRDNLAMALNPNRNREHQWQKHIWHLSKNAASDQDRAIVLASLFRPVVDGIVKDDGLPAMTPASILSGLIIGKSGGIAGASS